MSELCSHHKCDGEAAETVGEQAYLFIEYYKIGPATPNPEGSILYLPVATSGKLFQL